MQNIQNKQNIQHNIDKNTTKNIQEIQKIHQ